MQGKIVLANFFFISCDSCAQITANLKKVQDAFAHNDSMLQILSFTIKPQQDSVLSLKQYADKYNIDHDKWWFLTGDKKQIDSIAHHDFFINEGIKNKTDSNFIPLARWVLLDKHQFIRGYYNGLDSADVNRCMNDIALLMLEKEKR